ncbi:MAG: cyclic nucleotide-binding domain-containing protein [Chloroflexota bacterium]
MTSAEVSSTGARKSRLAAFFSVEGGEAGPVAALVGLNFAVSASFVLVQTSAFGLFIEAFGSHSLPYAYFSVAILSSLIAYLYLQLTQRVSFAAGLYLNLAFLAATCLFFWMGLRSAAARWFIFLLPFWFQTLVNLANLVVWHLAGHMFHVRQAKRLFGLIVAGNWLANILGGVLVASFLALVAPADLYLLAAFALLVSAVVLRATVARHPAAASGPAPALPRRTSGSSSIGSAFKHAYGRLIFAYTLFWWVSFFIIENIFFHQVEGQLSSSTTLATFLGWQLAVMGVIALLTTSVLTSRVAHRYGLRLGLLAMPVVVGATILLLALGGALGWSSAFLFWTATIARTLNVALGFSISQAMGTLLFQPMLGSLRSTTQTIAEGIMQPLAIGLAGIILLVFNTTLHFDAVGLSYIFLVVAVPWFWSIYELSRQYPLVMSEALKKRALGETTSVLFDASAITLLRNGLRHPRPGLALYALNQLEQVAPQAWPQALVDELPDLLDHSAPEVRLEALKRVLVLQPADALPVLRHALNDETDPRVRSMLLRVLAVMQDPQSGRQILMALEARHRLARQGAMIGLLSTAGAEAGPRAAAALRGLVASADIGDRLSACDILREIQHPDAAGHLIILTQDKAVIVRRTALRAVEHHAHPALVRALLAACDEPAPARVAENVLVAQGADNLGLLSREIGPGGIEGIPSGRALSIVRVLGRIRHPMSGALLRSVIAVPDPQLRLQVLLSLSRLGYRAGSAEETFSHVRSEVAHAAWLAAAIECVQGLDASAGSNVLNSALGIAFRDTRSRILLLLSFLYDAQAVLRARTALEESSTHHSPMALETVDALLPPAAKPWVLPLIEDRSFAGRNEGWRAAGVPVPAPTAAGTLQSLIGSADGTRHAPWTRMCAMYVAALSKEESCVPYVERAASEAHPGLAQMGRWSLARLAPADRRPGDVKMLSLVEKVLILKSAPLFAETPDNVLAEVAGLVEEVSFDADQAIFNKGEPGDSLYIIVSGAVKVWDGERLLNELGEGEAFGELALLDPEPRLATVKAAGSTNLLRLAAPDFREVLDAQPEVSAAIIRVVTKYLRSQLHYAREASARLRALESFSPLGQPADE